MQTPDWTLPGGVPSVISARTRCSKLVFRGVTSRVIAEAMSINGTGHLTSSDPSTATGSPGDAFAGAPGA